MAHKVITECGPGEMPEKERRKSWRRVHGGTEEGGGRREEGDMPDIFNILLSFFYFLK